MNNLVLEDGIAQGLFPGYVAVFAYGEERQYLLGGNLAFPDDVAVNPVVSDDTLYDLASLTKIHVFIAILKLIDLGFIKLADPLVKFLPFKGGGGIQRMTIWHMLTCTLDFKIPDDLNQKGLQTLGATGNLRLYDEAELVGPLGTMFRYSNISAFLAGEIIKKVYGTTGDLESPLHSLVLDPLGMNDTSYRMTPSRLVRIAPTQMVGTNEWQYGLMQDPMSQKFLPMQVGIAGLFASIKDMSKLLGFLMTGNTPSGQPLIRESLWKGMVFDQIGGNVNFSDGKRHRYGFGIDKPDIDPPYVPDESFCRDGVLMSGSSGPFIFAQPSRKRKNGSLVPIGGVLLTNTSRSILNTQEVHKNFRRKLVRSFLDSLPG